MEYIEKRQGRYYACAGECEIDNSQTFDSRINYKGVDGPKVIIDVGDLQNRL